MPKTCYQAKQFSAASMEIIRRAEEIMTQYAADGYDLTLRQLYYRFVAADWLSNTQQSYKRLGNIINDARLAGLLDWDHMVDRTRHLRALPHWQSATDILNSCAEQYRNDAWADQEWRLEVWVEKDALIGVVEAACREVRVPCFSCRGYTSQSELWAAGQRVSKYIEDGQRVKIIHLGDHDPSGIDMSRDIEGRIRMFTGEAEAVERIALNMDQIEEFKPPPNPAKTTDARYASYRERFGAESWELDALDPHYIEQLITERVMALRDEDAWQEAIAAEEEVRQKLLGVGTHWETVTATL